MTEFLIGDAIPEDVSLHVKQLTGLEPRLIDYRNHTIDVEDGRGFSQAEIDHMMSDAAGIIILRDSRLLYTPYIARAIRSSVRPVRQEVIMLETQLHAAKEHFRVNRIAEDSDTAIIIIASILNLEECYKDGSKGNLSFEDFSYSFGEVPVEGLPDEMEIRTKCPAHTLIPIWIKVGREVIQRAITGHPELF